MSEREAENTESMPEGDLHQEQHGVSIDQPGYIHTEEFQNLSLYEQLVYYHNREGNNAEQILSQLYENQHDDHQISTRVQFDDHEDSEQEQNEETGSPQTPQHRTIYFDSSDIDTPHRDHSPSARLMENDPYSGQDPEENIDPQRDQQRRQERRRRRRRRRRSENTEEPSVQLPPRRQQWREKMRDYLLRYLKALRFTFVHNNGSKLIVFIILLILIAVVQFFASFIKQPRSLQIVFYCSIASSILCIGCSINLFLIKVCAECLYPSTLAQDESGEQIEMQDLDQFNHIQREIAMTINSREDMTNLTDRQRRRMQRRQRRRLRQLLQQLYIMHNQNSHVGELFRLSMMDRDFNENDYSMLSNLDRYQAHTGATESQIRQLPTMTIEKEADMESIQHSQCVICFEDYQLGDTLQTLPCFHQYHKDCVTKWLAMKSQCPVCQTCCFDSARDQQFLSV